MRDVRALRPVVVDGVSVGGGGSGVGVAGSETTLTCAGSSFVVPDTERATKNPSAADKIATRTIGSASARRP